MDRAHVIGKYIEWVLEHGEAPPSVFRFAKELEISEREFFEAFASFEALEASIWRDVLRDTVRAVSSGDEWQGFTVHQRLLTFYYAFFDKILDHRSFYLARFPRLRRNSQPPVSLRLMREEFCIFTRAIIAEGIERQELPSRGKLNQTYPVGMFLHLLSAIEFNLKDDSQRFERTDAYIEKSVRLGFDLIGNQAIDSALDLARFVSGRSWGKDS